MRQEITPIIAPTATSLIKWTPAKTLENETVIAATIKISENFLNKKLRKTAAAKEV
jgi:hypothetical protein